MTKNDVRFKTNVTIQDKVNAIKGIVASYFVNGEYTPYYADMAKVIAVVTYFIDGLEFDENENIYDSVINDEDVMDLVEEIMYDDNMTFVKDMVNDKVEFIKQQVIHSHADTNKIIETCNVIIDSLDNFAKLNLEQISKDDMEIGLNILRQFSQKEFTMENLSEAIKNAVGFDIDKASAEIIEAKNAEIRELKKYKTLWEERNASSDKIVSLTKKV